MKNINNGFTVLNKSLLASSYYLPICVTFSQHFNMKNFKVGSKAVRLLYTHQPMYHEFTIPDLSTNVYCKQGHSTSHRKQ